MSFQVTKLTLRPVPNPHTNQVLHEAEVWIKDGGRGRRKLDLLVKYSTRHPDKVLDNPLRSAGGSLEQINPLLKQQQQGISTSNNGGESSYPSNGY